MMIGLKPFELLISKQVYGLHILGIIYGKSHGQYYRSLGFSFAKERKPDRSVWKLNLACYWWHKHITVKTNLDGHYCKCNLCGGMVWKGNLYCPTCGDEVLAYDVTFVYRRPENHEDEIRELRESGYKVAITRQVIMVESSDSGRHAILCTPRELRRRFPEMEIVPQFGYDKIDDAGCLCQVNIDATLSKADIPFKMDEACDYVIE